MAVYLPSLHKDNGAGSLSADGNTSSIFYEKGLTISNDVLLPIQTKVTNYFIDGVASDVNFSIASNDVLTLGATNGVTMASVLNMNGSDINLVPNITNYQGDININAGSDFVSLIASKVNLTANNEDINLTATGGVVKINNSTLSKIQFNTGTATNPASIYQDDTGDLYVESNSSQLAIQNTFGGVSITSGDYLNIDVPDNINITSSGGVIVLNAQDEYVSINTPSVYVTNATLGDGTINGNLNGKVNLSTASANQNYTILVANANTGNQNIKGSGSDLNYNPVSQTLSVKNMIVSGNETQTGIITTNVLRTDIMIQQVTYLSAQVNNLANFAALLTLGTFIMTTFSNSTIVNSIVTIGLPALPNDGSYDGYTFQLRKLNGGVTQTAQNWTITAPTAIIIPNGNTLNSGSGGANSSSSPSSFVQRYTIVTSGGVGYYVGCNN
jgi:hypothetical protein